VATQVAALPSGIPMMRREMEHCAVLPTSDASLTAAAQARQPWRWRRPPLLLLTAGHAPRTCRFQQHELAATHTHTHSHTRTPASAEPAVTALLAPVEHDSGSTGPTILASAGSVSAHE
jgi:hypothetical protein